jgi:hypothetical protein
MTHTIQPCSYTMLGDTGKDITTDSGESKDGICNLSYIYDNLINLSKSLTRMNNVQNKLFKKLTAFENIVHNI